MKYENPYLQLKNVSRRMLLNYMRSNERVTKAGVSSVTGLTFMAIKKIITELQELHLIREDRFDAECSVGRKAQYYTINENYGYAVGVHINRFATRAAVVDLKGRILAKSVRDMGTELEKQDSLMKMLYCLIEEVIEKSQIERSKILGIGAGVPGPINMTEGIVLSPPDFPALQYLPLRELLAEHFSYPVRLHKDTNVIALGEFWNGAGKGCSQMAYVDLDIGIGNGFVVDGTIHSGAHQLAGEFGHITLEADGPLCSCGNNGCLEAISSGAALLKTFKRKLSAMPEHALYEKRETLQMGDILEAVRKNDLLALEIFNQAAYYTGIAINNMLNLLDPQVLVIGGMLIRDNPRYLETVRSVTVKRRLKGAESCEILHSVLSKEGGSIGAGILVIDHFFNALVNDVLRGEEKKE